MTLHNIGLHMIGLGLFIVLLALLSLLCKIVDRAIVYPPRSGTSTRRSSTSYHAGTEDIHLTPLMAYGRKTAV